jgi:diadenosine tetraphosphate (Ap4A) HIT family hydrolase
MSWQTAIEQCANYRKFLSGLDIDESLKTKAVLIEKEAIKSLYQQGCDGIRVYIGHDENSQVHLHVVGTKNGDDYGVPTGEQLTSKVLSTSLVTTRPCPVQCTGSQSVMNS